jgi:hypothetical protein
MNTQQDNLANLMNNLTQNVLNDNKQKQEDKEKENLNVYIQKIEEQAGLGHFELVCDDLLEEKNKQYLEEKGFKIESTPMRDENYFYDVDVISWRK